MKRLIKKIIKAENFNQYDDEEVFVSDNMTSMEKLNQLQEADVKHDRCPACHYTQLKKDNGFKICPRCRNTYKLLNGDAYLIYTGVGE